MLTRLWGIEAQHAHAYQNDPSVHLSLLPLSFSRSICPSLSLPLSRARARSLSLPSSLSPLFWLTRCISAFSFFLSPITPFPFRVYGSIVDSDRCTKGCRMGRWRLVRWPDREGVLTVGGVVWTQRSASQEEGRERKKEKEERMCPTKRIKARLVHMHVCLRSASGESPARPCRSDKPCTACSHRQVILFVCRVDVGAVAPLSVFSLFWLFTVHWLVWACLLVFCSVSKCLQMKLYYARWMNILPRTRGCAYISWSVYLRAFSILPVFAYLFSSCTHRK